MITLSQIETDLTAAMKAKNQVAVDTLRGLKTRIQNERISKMRELAEADLIILIRSELKKRKEAAASYSSGGRMELAEKELQEAGILEKYLPQQMSEAQLSGLIEKFLAENQFTQPQFSSNEDSSSNKSQEAVTSDAGLNTSKTGAGFTVKDFGAVMGKLKARVGDKADGSTLARLLKERLK